MNQASLDIATTLVQQGRTNTESFPGTFPTSLTSLFGSHKVSDRDRIDFCTQLSVMLLSKVPMQRALDVLELQCRRVGMRRIILSVKSRVTGGASLSVALKSHPEAFDDLFIVSTEIGEESGRLGETLASLADHLDKIAVLKRKLLQAMTYPALVALVATGAVSFLLAFVVPTFADMFKSFQMELPWSTRVVLRVSDAVSTYGSYVFLALFAGVLLARHVITSARMKRCVDRYAMRLPILGEVLLHNYLARFCRTLGTMLKSQVSLIDALVTTRRILTNAQLQAEVQAIEDAVRAGRNIASPLLASRLFPPMVAQMIVVGEETSALDDMLLKVAAYYEGEIDAKVETMSAVVEPVIIVFVGIAVAMILLSMYLPMFEMVNGIPQ